MRLAYIVIISFGSVFLGYAIRLAASSRGGEGAVMRTSAFLKTVAIVFVTPLATINSLWGISFSGMRLVLLPFFGVTALSLGGAAGLFLIRMLKLEPYKAGSLFTSCLFSNISTLAAFVAFMMFGDAGFVTIQLYALMELPFYYAVAFPFSYEVSKGMPRNFRFSLKNFRDKPIVFFPLAAVAAGLLLRVSPVQKPAFMDGLSSVLVPAMAVLFGLSIGLTLKIGKVRLYRREIALVHGIKFLLIPAVLSALGYIAGLPRVMGGVPFKSLVVASFSPVGFLAVVPPTVYGFDVDLANSAWLVSTLSYAVILPFLLTVLQ